MTLIETSETMATPPGHDAPDAPPQLWRRVSIAPSRATAGMRLLEDVRLANGTVLIAAGATLDEAALQRLQRRQVDYLRVAEADMRTDVERAERLAAVMRRIDYLFRGDTSPARDLLKAQVQRYRCEEESPCRIDL